MKIFIRPAQMIDAEIIARFNVALALESENLQLNPARVREGVRALLRDPAKGIYFVAEVDGKIAGQVLITYEWSDWRNGNFWWLQSVYVEKEFRARGIFKALFAHVVELAKGEKDVYALRLYMDADNASARSAYNRLGMTRTNYEIFELVLTGPEASS